MSRTKQEILAALQAAGTDFQSAIYGKNVRQGLVDVEEAVYDAVDQWGALIDDTLMQSGEAADAKAVGDRASMFRRSAPITDLNQATEPGWYMLSVGTHYDHEPSQIAVSHRRLLFVANSTTAFTEQIMCDIDAGQIATRVNAYGSSGWEWSSWAYSPNSNGLFMRRDLSQEADPVPDSSPVTYNLDTIRTPGWYTLSYGKYYPGQPPQIPANCRRLLLSMNDGASFMEQIMLNMDDGTFATRTRTSDGSTWNWSDWGGAKPETTNTQFLRASDYYSQRTAANAGATIDVLTYNVARYTNDTQYSTLVPISAGQISAIKKLLSKYKPDFVAIQEDNVVIDPQDKDHLSTGNKPANDYIYKPVFPCCYGGGGTTIKSRIAGSSGNVFVTRVQDASDSSWNTRAFRVEYYTIESKTLLFICVHPTAGLKTEANKALIRQAEYEQIFEWANGQISLFPYDDSPNPYTDDSKKQEVGSWDWCVIAGDFNVTVMDDIIQDGTDTVLAPSDISVLTDLCETWNFSMANGGWMGWFNTNVNPNEGDFPHDNIIVSPNIIINAVEAPEKLTSQLYSDHCPIYANLTLL